MATNLHVLFFFKHLKLDIGFVSSALFYFYINAKHVGRKYLLHISTNNTSFSDLFNFSLMSHFLMFIHHSIHSSIHQALWLFCLDQRD